MADAKNDTLDAARDVLIKYGPPMATGAVSNVVSTMLTLPIMYAWTVRQLDPSKGYGQITRYALTRAGIKDVFSVSKTIMAMAPRQSIAYLGTVNMVIHWMDQNRPESGSLERGFVAGAFAAVSESLVTAGASRDIIKKWAVEAGEATATAAKQSFFQRMNPMAMSRAELSSYARCLEITLIKNLFANCMTVMAVLVTKDALRKEFPDLDEGIVSAGGGLIGAAAAGSVFAPVITLQTNVLNSPDKTIGYHVRHLLTTRSMRDLWSGASGRILQKSVQAMIGFGMISVMDRAVRARLLVEDDGEYDDDDDNDDHDGGDGHGDHPVLDVAEATATSEN